MSTYITPFTINTNSVVYHLRRSIVLLRNAPGMDSIVMISNDGQTKIPGFGAPGFFEIPKIMIRIKLLHLYYAAFQNSDYYVLRNSLFFMQIP